MTFTPEVNEKRDMSKGARDGWLVRHWWIVLLVVCLIGAGAYFLFAKKQSGASKQGEGPATPMVPVVAVEAKKAAFNLYINGLGSVTPVNTITVHTRVDGQLMEVLYREGQIVSLGDLLARLDPRPFEVQLTQAEGQMARDVAQLQNARLDLERFQVLWKQDSVAKQQLDTQEALVRQLEGTVKNDQGQIDSAKLNLVYCQITAPISGRVGLRLVDPGNIVHVTDTNGLVVITQLQPITIIFPIPEDNLPQVLARLKAGGPLLVEAYDREMRQRLAVGSLLTIDNQIDPTTGTVRLKAIFPNERNELFPNQFVNARLLVDVRRDATVVPSPAIQRGPQGTFVYVVKADRTATVRPVTVDQIQGGEASIRTGLSPGELVVVDGAERLREGTRADLRPQSSGAAENVNTQQKGY
ncbi:MAG TPA: MdtA/MuxA family multidrug efflux RND transporter periplasmic adaptor subunit [Thermodesulfobacteriota bacterium]|nr:MdtA/MuxA family multidrug efflux RND transporter periplasmic adaptor subunit [Thermodesulfobacteriota bacterium]